MDRDIFIVFRQQYVNEKFNKVGQPQIMGAFYTQEKAYHDADLWRTESPNLLISYDSWVERTKLSR